jgi:ADP-ribosylglycohydrolase/fructose-1,6-bisphosphatase/inositol monophosphatase family enzyme
MYRAQLDCAVAAALAAGAMLREEFHRPGGPRAHGPDHADVDEEAERVIRSRLLEEFPEYGYEGEELGDSGHAREYRWIVDPNDGTNSFIKGFRGSAVSIALERAGEPVVGVVYAPCAPDDDGDLFAWAEGCGPLLRNGEPVQRCWATEAKNELTIIASLGADGHPLENARFAAPMRFRTLPSIAYRLALVAAGEAEATFSLNNVVSWDYAGGRALLCGVGGEFDLEQNWCFGGAPALCRLLRERAPRMRLKGSPASGARALVRPVPGKSIDEPAVLARAQGCLLGQFAGDSLGSLVEFQRKPGRVTELRDGGYWGTLAGQPTDDSEMALALARTLVRLGRFDAEEVRKAYVAWKNSGPFDIGGTTATGLAGTPNRGSQANGALMRISPLGIYGAFRPSDEVAAWAREDAALTHPHPTCIDASAVFATTLAYAIRTGASADDVHRFAVSRATEPAILDALKRAASARPEDYITHFGWVLIALQNAFYQLLHAPSLEEGVIDTVSQGGDTDTNACIAGALLGAVHGRPGIPWRWVDRILTCRPMPGMADHPRPEEYWPVDVLVLAEALAAV